MTGADGRMLHLGAFLYTPGNHSAGWRQPDAVPSTDMDFAQYVAMAHTAERGKMDMLFFQDTAAVNGSAGLTGGSGIRPNQGRQVHLAPVELIAALAAVTTRIGLVSTATTTYNEPYNVARAFATIDHISGGRAGWNLVTSQSEDEAGNFSRDKHVEHGLRYERAEEFYDVVAGLWDSWDADAFLHDKEQGVYFDRDKVHYLHHKGGHFSVRGPLNVSRTPQGRPVVSQAGSSEAGMELAARTADLVFTAQTTVAEGRAFCADLRARAVRHGRAPGDIKVLPGLMPVLGRTEAEARERYEALQAMLSEETSMRALARLCGGLDIYAFDPDGPLPELPDSNAARARQDMVRRWAREDGLTIRQVAKRLGASQGHHLVHGTPERFADLMGEWLREGACDGFNLLFPYFPGPLEDFVDWVVPVLQERGIYRRDYAGTTLREHLGVPVPRSRHAG
ncbi:LLM class flavin-dependent oxidoreductase [Roseomonas sp. OT10]|uniref:LLM class flavin-dependent oxidoreductase n=1 Tax=Roseomonas cutis TaxID=2897332 RepID=UPI001E2D2DBA|nr:LLM class flavin-dependent oxidoreductase [Roseomonas sp. OT10]UFN49664.1 LLM class flavin-dependent oxidoreductase [Roseomonas sp. OT10]